MKNNTDNLLNAILQQAELFIVDMDGFFYPFGTYVNNNDEIVPISAYSKNEYPDSIELIDILEDYIQNIFQNNCCKIAALAICVIINSGGQDCDAIEIRLFDGGK